MYAQDKSTGKPNIYKIILYIQQNNKIFNRYKPLIITHYSDGFLDNKYPKWYSMII